MRFYPVGSAAWRRVLVPVAGSLAMGFCFIAFFQTLAGSGVPQTKAALFARDGFISLRTVLGKFFCTATTLASGISAGTRGSVGSGGSRNRICPRSMARIEPGKGKGANSRGGCGCYCRSIQYTNGGSSVFTRRGNGRSERTDSGVGRTCLGDLLGGVAAAVGQ